MNLAYKVVGDATVLAFFADCTKKERQELMLIFHDLAEVPHQRGAWVRRTASAHDLSIKMITPFPLTDVGTWV